MEEADKIIIPILKSMGCNLDETIKSMSQFTAPLVVHCCAICINALDTSKSLSTEFPKHSKTQQFGIGNSLKNSFIKLGYPYPNDIGYETFIYPNEHDTRKILRWLVEKLQKHNKTKDGGDAMSVGVGGGKRDGSSSSSSSSGRGIGNKMDSKSNIDISGTTGGGSIEQEDQDDEQEIAGGRNWLNKQISENLRKWIHTPYTFLVKPQTKCPFKSVPIFFPNKNNSLINAKEQRYWNQDLPWISQQVNNDDELIPSILAFNHRQYLESTIGSGGGGDKTQEQGDDGGLSNIFQGVDWSSVIKESFQREMQESAYHKKWSGIKNLGAGSGGPSQHVTGFLRAAQFMRTGDDQATMVNDDGTLIIVDSTGAVKTEETEEEMEKRKNEELESMRSKISGVEEKLKAMQEEIEKEHKKKQDMEQTIENEKQQLQQLRDEISTKEKTNQLLSGGNGEENLKKLEDIVRKQRDKLKSSVEQWEARKKLWMDEWRKKKESMENREKKCNDLVEEMKAMRKEMKQCAKEIREKEELLEKVVARLNKLPKTFDRQVYVDRILGVVANLETQNKQIKQVLEDIHELQRETNKITEKSKRAFNICDDMIFQAAQSANEEQMRKQLNKCYRNVVSLREQFDRIIENTRKASNIQNEIRDLESQLLALQSKVETLDTEKVKQDAKEVAQENEELVAKLKALKKQLKVLKQSKK